MIRKTIFTFLLSVAVLFCSAQNQAPFLTLDEAITIGLENNYAIRISSNEKNILTNNASIGNAGLLPSINATGNATNNTVNSKQQFFNGNEQEVNGGKSTNYNANISLGWTIFDGLSMFATYDRLKELEALGEVNARLTIQNTVFEIIATYYDIARRQRELKSLSEALDISRLRVKNANNRYLVGTGSKLDLLASKVDFNEDTTSYIRQVELVASTKIRLNELLARDLNIIFSVSEEIPLAEQLLFEDIRAKTLELNPFLVTAVINKNIARLTKKEIAGNRFPELRLNSAYNLTRFESEFGQLLNNRSQGFNYGLSLTIPIFNGFNQNRLEKNANISIKNAELNYEQTLNSIEANIITVYNNYVNSKSLIILEESNLDIARQNFEITLDKFNLGSITALELREAQRNFILANNRFLQVQFQAKLAEISLKAFYGGL